MFLTSKLLMSRKLLCAVRIEMPPIEFSLFIHDFHSALDLLSNIGKVVSKESTTKIYESVPKKLA